jgi:hypothetical protein
MKVRSLWSQQQQIISQKLLVNFQEIGLKNCHDNKGIGNWFLGNFSYFQML